MVNPLSAENDLPLFSQFKPEHIEPAIKELINANRKTIEQLLADNKIYTWENLVFPLENLTDTLQEKWGFVKHLNAVRDTPEWRKEHDRVMLKVTDFFVELRQHPELYQAMLSIQSSPEFAKLSMNQKKVIENYLRDFKLSGISLDKDKKEQFKALLEKLSENKNKFSQNVLDATDNWFLLITEESKLKGLPTHTLHKAKEEAEKKGQTGWRLTLDFPCYHAMISYADNRELRKEVYQAYTTLASDQSLEKNWDNGSLMVEQLKIKHAIAELLGYGSYAEYSLVKKMLKTPKEVMNFLNELIVPVKTKALQDVQLLEQFAAKKYGLDKIEPWDTRYLTEKLLEQQYNFSEEELRYYFPESHVINGLFEIANKLFKITIKEVKNFDAWHECVKLYEMFDEKQQLLGRFYMDLYARPHKRSGAWCGTCKNRIEKLDSSLQTPIAYIVANFRPRIAEEKEALLSHDEIITLFHEFGHCLHFISSKMIYPSISPDHGVSWDAIELPSQLMENWCWEEEALQLISKHIESSKPLPLDLISKLKSSKNFLIGLAMIRQLEFSVFDFELHLQSNIQNYLTIQKIIDKVRENTMVIPIPTFNRFQNTFSHIFAGSYAAGYYSYLWSEVLSADTYNFFKEKSQVFDQTVAQRYMHTILEPGGSKEFMDLYLEFRGRPPKVKALLQDWGL